MGLSLFASRQNALLFFGETFEKKLFNVKRAQFCFSRALVELEEVFFTFVGLRYSKFCRRSWQSDFSTQKIASEVQDLMVESWQKSDSLWEFVKVIGSKKCFKEFVFFLREVSKGFRERGRQKLRWDHRRKEQSLWKNVETHTLGLVGGKKKSQKRSRNQHQKIFHSVISKIAFSVSSSFLPNSLALSHSGNVEKPEKRMFKNLFWKKKPSASTIVCAALRIEENSFRKTSRIFISFQFNLETNLVMCAVFANVNVYEWLNWSFSSTKNYIIIS